MDTIDLSLQQLKTQEDDLRAKLEQLEECRRQVFAMHLAEQLESYRAWHETEHGRRPSEYAIAHAARMEPSDLRRIKGGRMRETSVLVGRLLELIHSRIEIGAPSRGGRPKQVRKPTGKMFSP